MPLRRPYHLRNSSHPSSKTRSLQSKAPALPQAPPATNSSQPSLTTRGRRSKLELQNEGEVERSSERRFKRRVQRKGDRRGEGSQGEGEVGLGGGSPTPVRISPRKKRRQLPSQQASGSLFFHSLEAQQALQSLTPSDDNAEVHEPYASPREVCLEISVSCHDHIPVQLNEKTHLLLVTGCFGRYCHIE